MTEEEVGAKVNEIGNNVLSGKPKNFTDINNFADSDLFVSSYRNYVKANDF